jgi:hypothetical protein
MDKEIMEALLEAKDAMFKAANLMLFYDDEETKKHGGELRGAGLVIDQWLIVNGKNDVFSNNDFTAWTKDDPDSWVIAGNDK